MKRCRTLLSVLLGLVLLAQGFAVSAAPRAKLSESAPASASVVADMPCNGQKALKQDETGKPHRSCCNASCPDMTTCALGHLASATTVSLMVPTAAGAQPSLPPVRAESRALSSLLRPPISFHG